MRRARRLICAMCGQITRGRQWWNRDKGYGLCPKCYDWMIKRGEDPKEIEFSYGQKGTHFCVV